MEKASRCPGRPVGAVMVTVALALGGAPALGAGPGPDRPWATGVSIDAQREADALFRVGVEMVKDAFFTRGVEHLRASAALWDHPATHYNLAKALLNLDQPAAALEHLWRAMRYGGAPLSADHIGQVRHFSDLLFSTEVAHVVVRSTAPGVSITIDGAPLLDGPGSRELLVASGAPRTLVVTAGGAEVARLERRFAPGKRTEVAFAQAAPGATPQIVERVPGAKEMRALERAIVGFEVAWPTAAQLAAKQTEERRRAREMASAADADVPVSGGTAKICAGATQGDVVTVCRDLEATQQELARHRRLAKQAAEEAARRLEEYTRGGVVEALD